MMAGARIRWRHCSVPKCFLIGAGAAVWLLLLLVNSTSRSRTELHFQTRTERAIDLRRSLHVKHLYKEIGDLMRRRPLNWTQFLATEVERRFDAAPCACSCGHNAATLRACPRPLQRLQGDLSKDVERAIALRLDNPLHLEPRTGMGNGGRWGPEECRARDRIAVIVPFRDRWTQLKTLLAVLHPMLQRQGSCYRVFVVEQYGGGAFNKGRLNNAGFLEAATRFRFDCVVFQDADIVPLHDFNYYRCPRGRPLHMAVAVDVHKFRLPYAALVGGVIAFDTKNYVRVNGYSNLYWGWGLEDDDMELRMKTATKIRYTRPSRRYARYKALSHRPQRIYGLQGARRKPLLSTVLRRYRFDGLNTVKYEVIAERLEPSYTHLILFIGEQPSDFNDE